MRVRRRDAMLALAVAGAGIASYLTWVAFDEDVEPICTGLGDCQQVQSSQYAEVGGVPVAVLGLLMYLGLLALLLVQRAGPAMLRGESGPVGPWVFALAAAGALYSAYLTYLEFFVIEAVCAWCLASAGVVTALAVLAALDVRPGGTRGSLAPEWEAPYDRGDPGRQGPEHPAE